MNVRRAEPGDGAALARLHGEAGAAYAALSPAELRPDVDDLLQLVADLDGEVVGALAARIVPPAEGDIQPDAAHTRLRIDYLITAGAHQGRGYAARLVETAEAWGRERGATVAEAWTEPGSPVPFWKGRLAYAERSVNVRKPLA
jgi:GNAT superfamily N-acetyltransferase